MDNRLDGLKIASPCSESWEKMTGDARVRACAACKLNVYDLSEMTRPEAEALVEKTEGRLCVRFYRRADGTVLTKDCPVGLRAVRVRALKIVAGTAALAAGLFAWLGLRQFCRVVQTGRTMGMASAPLTPTLGEPVVNPLHSSMGEIRRPMPRRRTADQ